VKRKIGGLYLILDQQFTSRDIISIAIEAIKGGVDVIQYREKVRSKREGLTTARRLRDITYNEGVTFIVNDDPAVAFAVDADGVHLGQEDIPTDVAREILGSEKIIGLSTHTYEEAVEAEHQNVDYIGFGPVFHSSTKMVGSPHGPWGLARIRNSVSLPIVAIGGITMENVVDVIEAGAEGIAVISAILSARDIEETVREFKKRMEIGRRFSRIPWYSPEYRDPR